MKRGILTVEKRDEAGSAAARRLRGAGRVPGVVYGGGGSPVHVAAAVREVEHALKTGVRILDLRVGAESMPALLKDVQYDSLGERLLHVDFQRLVKGKPIEIRVPLVFKGTPVGLKKEGVFNVVMSALEVHCLPEDVPESLEGEVSSLDIGQSIHVRDLRLPKGVTTKAPPEEVLAVVTYSHKLEEPAPAVPEEAAVQPEVIGEVERKSREEAKVAEDSAAKEARKKEKKEEK